MNGYAVYVKSTQDNAGAWASKKRGKPIQAVSLVENATHFERRKDAEALAVLVAGTFPYTIGRIKIVEYGTWQEMDKITNRWHDFTVNLND